MRRADEIKPQLIEMLERYPDGLRWRELYAMIREADPALPHHVVDVAIWELPNDTEPLVYKPARGLYRLIKFQSEDPSSFDQKSDVPLSPGAKRKEEDFYEPFREYLLFEEEECTKAIVLGGNKFQRRWGTPDVIGIWGSRKTDFIHPYVEVISAEIKLDPNAIITAFGQACAYKLFSHKVYLVIPGVISRNDKSRIESLCVMLQIGLVYFDPEDPTKSSFQTKIKPHRHDPDIFYTNENLRLIEAAFD